MPRRGKRSWPGPRPGAPRPVDWSRRGISPLWRRVTFSAMRKSPKNRRGTAQDGHSVSIFALPPVPHYGGRIPASPSKISGAQNLNDALNSRRATGPWVCKICPWCHSTAAPDHAEPTLPIQNTGYLIRPLRGHLPLKGKARGNGRRPKGVGRHGRRPCRMRGTVLIMRAVRFNRRGAQCAPAGRSGTGP